MLVPFLPLLSLPALLLVLSPSRLAGISAVAAAEGSSTGGATSSPQSAGYTCDPVACQLPACHCASPAPPGGLAPADTPQFITFTADDAIQFYTRDAVNFFLAQRKNPNGCAPKMTWFTSLSYTNYSMVTDWYVSGNEIADHTMTHVGAPPSNEILGNLKALNAFSGIPLSAIKGFRAPFLNYTGDTLTQLKNAGFTYDSSATSASPANSTTTDAFWPYTLDYGFANDCLQNPAICKGALKLPGLWEIPLYSVFETVNTTAGIHLMDPWLDAPANMTVVLEWLKNSFLTHYEGNRQPFGLYTHPIHLAVGYPGVVDPIAMRTMINQFLDWAQARPNVWIVSNEQLLSWMRAPTSNANIAQTTALGCSVPNVDPTLKICNGMTANEIGLLTNCPFIDFPWTTCYGCPVVPPTPANPTPPQNISIGGIRNRLPGNCSPAFFDPIGNKCLCTAASCAFTDQTRAIGNYTLGLSGGESQPTPVVPGSSNATSTSVPPKSSALSLVSGWGTWGVGLIVVGVMSW